MNSYILLTLIQTLATSAPKIVEYAFSQPQIIETPPIEVPIYDTNRVKFDPALYVDSSQTGTKP
jgi:hypothetical protein